MKISCVESPKVENNIKIEENKVEINVEAPKIEDLKVKFIMRKKQDQDHKMKKLSHKKKKLN